MDQSYGTLLNSTVDYLLWLPESELLLVSLPFYRHLLNLQSSFLPFQITGRSGRAGRPGEAITFYTEEDKPFLRNIANVMAVSHCEVPAWILALPKLRKRKHRPHRDSISTLPDDST